jgi:hypothetical protein
LWRASHIVFTPSIPRPPLFIKNTRKLDAYSKNGAKAFAPNGFTALSDISNSAIFFPIKEFPIKEMASGISVFKRVTNISCMSILVKF